MRATGLAARDRVTEGDGGLPSLRFPVPLSDVALPPDPPRRRKRHDGFIAWLFLGILFFFTRHGPWFLWATRSMWVQWGWRIVKSLRRSLLANAVRVLGPGSRLDARTRYAHDVIDSFFGFIAELGEHAGSSREDWLKLVESVEGVEAYHAARARKNGSIFAT